MILTIHVGHRCFSRGETGVILWTNATEKKEEHENTNKEQRKMKNKKNENETNPHQKTKIRIFPTNFSDYFSQLNCNFRTKLVFFRFFPTIKGETKLAFTWKGSVFRCCLNF